LAKSGQPSFDSQYLILVKKGKICQL